MPVVWSDRHRLHDPRAEIFVGVRTPGTELPERAERIRAVLVERGADVVEARGSARRRPDERSLARADRAPRRRVGRLGCRRPHRRSRAGPGGAVPVPTSRAVLRPRAAHRHRRHGARRPVRLRHHDARGPEHVGGRARRARGGGHRGGSRERRGARRVRVHAPARAPRHPQRLRRLVLPEQSRRPRARLRGRGTHQSP